MESIPRFFTRKTIYDRILFCHWLIVHSKLSKLGVIDVGMLLNRTEVRSISRLEFRLHIPIGQACQITNK
jgi:hypothetical protein